MRQHHPTAPTFLPTLAALATLTALAPAQSWRQLAPPAAPPARTSSALVTDPTLGRSILFGGWTGAAYLNDCWSFDGTAWTPLPGGPAIRGRHGMAFDEARGVAVLFGGINSTAVTGYLADTWEFANGAWSQRPTGIQRPTARFGHAMAFDRLRQRVVLFGGRTNAGTIFLNDTWEWNGTSWSYFTPANAPTRRMDHALVTDPLTGNVLLFGGMPLGGPVNGETWTWNGSAWVQLAPAHSPSPRMQAVVALDDRRARVVLYGGYDGNDLVDTWQWDGVDWQSVATPLQPGVPVLPTLAAGPAGGGVVLFGGQTSGGANQNATWQFDQFAAATAYGTGCGNPTLALAAVGGMAPALGAVFQSSFGPIAAGAVPFQSLGWSDAAVGAMALPLDLAPWSMPGCWLLQDAAAPFLPCTTAGGAAIHTFAIPASSVFAGFRLFLQGFVLDPAVNAAGLATSNGLRLELGF